MCSKWVKVGYKSDVTNVCYRRGNVLWLNLGVCKRYCYLVLSLRQCKPM